eukprot:SAG11_NODE_1977_length_3973_cov_5.740836_1_plen_938_part_00
MHELKAVIAAASTQRGGEPSDIFRSNRGPKRVIDASIVRMLTGNERIESMPARDERKNPNGTSELHSEPAQSVDSTQAVSNSATYMRMVQSTAPDKYEPFLHVMREFHSQAIDTHAVVEQIKDLFYTSPKLLVGFNVFLPPNHSISLPMTDAPFFEILAESKEAQNTDNPPASRQWLALQNMEKRAVAGIRSLSRSKQAPQNTRTDTLPGIMAVAHKTQSTNVVTNRHKKTIRPKRPAGTQPLAADDGFCPVAPPDSLSDKRCAAQGRITGQKRAAIQNLADRDRKRFAAQSQGGRGLPAASNLVQEIHASNIARVHQQNKQRRDTNRHPAALCYAEQFLLQTSHYATSNECIPQVMHQAGISTEWPRRPNPIARQQPNSASNSNSGQRSRSRSKATTKVEAEAETEAGTDLRQKQRQRPMCLDCGTKPSQYGMHTDLFAKRDPRWCRECSKKNPGALMMECTHWIQELPVHEHRQPAPSSAPDNGQAAQALASGHARKRKAVRTAGVILQERGGRRAAASKQKLRQKQKQVAQRSGSQANSSHPCGAAVKPEPAQEAKLRAVHAPRARPPLQRQQAPAERPDRHRCTDCKQISGNYGKYPGYKGLWCGLCAPKHSAVLVNNSRTKARKQQQLHLESSSGTNLQRSKPNFHWSKSEGIQSRPNGGPQHKPKARPQPKRKGGPPKKGTRMCDDCGSKTKNYGLLEVGVCRWCCECGKKHGAVLLHSQKSKALANQLAKRKTKPRAKNRNQDLHRHTDAELLLSAAAADPLGLRIQKSRGGLGQQPWQQEQRQHLLQSANLLHAQMCEQMPPPTMHSHNQFSDQNPLPPVARHEDGRLPSGYMRPSAQGNTWTNPNMSSGGESELEQDASGYLAWFHLYCIFHNGLKVPVQAGPTAARIRNLTIRPMLLASNLCVLSMHWPRRRSNQGSHRFAPIRWIN